MAIDPHLIIMAVEAAGNEKVRKTVLYIVFFVLGLIMLIFVAYGGLMSGLFAVVQNNRLKIEWAYYSKSISDVFKDVKNEIGGDLKKEVYDFMPNFSVNLSKAIISENAGGEAVVFDENYLGTAEEYIPKYEYKSEAVTVDGKNAKRQTLTVSEDGEEKTVEYTCIGGSIYLPEFLAMFNVRQTQNYLIGISEENTSDVDKQIEEIVGGLPETSEDMQDYLNGNWDKAINGGSDAAGINIFETAALKAVIQKANLNGAATVTTERTEDKLSITLETISSDTWKKIFGIDESLYDYVEQTKLTVEMALDAAKIPIEERTISLDGIVQLTLFEYFDGLFEPPVDHSDIRGIRSRYGGSSGGLHVHGGEDVTDNGLTLRLNGGAAVYAKPMESCADVIQDAFIYDVWNMDEAEIDEDGELYNRSAVTFAYIIDTKKFEKMYGFQFPRVEGVVTDSGYVTLFLEYSCLNDTVFERNDIGKAVSGDARLGHAHNGAFSEEFDAGDSRHSQENCVPHLGIKVHIKSGKTDKPSPSKDDTRYGGLSARDIGVAVDPSLWFKDFCMGSGIKIPGSVSAAVPK